MAKAMCIGLVLCAVGDASLFMDDEVGMWDKADPSKPSPFFLCGLIAFLAGHVQYIKVFMVGCGSSAHEVRFLLPFLLYFFGIMTPIFDVIWGTPLYLPVIVYGLILTAMGYLAFLWHWVSLESTEAPRGGSSLKQQSGRAFWGAVFFVISDSVRSKNICFVCCRQCASMSVCISVCVFFFFSAFIPPPSALTPPTCAFPTPLYTSSGARLEQVHPRQAPRLPSRDHGPRCGDGDVLRRSGTHLRQLALNTWLVRMQRSARSGLFRCLHCVQSSPSSRDYGDVLELLHERQWKYQCDDLSDAL